MYSVLIYSMSGLLYLFFPLSVTVSQSFRVTAVDRYHPFLPFQRLRLSLSLTSICRIGFERQCSGVVPGRSMIVRLESSKNFPSHMGWTHKLSTALLVLEWMTECLIYFSERNRGTRSKSCILQLDRAPARYSSAASATKLAPTGKSNMWRKTNIGSIKQNVNDRKYNISIASTAHRSTKTKQTQFTGKEYNNNVQKTLSERGTKNKLVECARTNLSRIFFTNHIHAFD